jgi:hypothetical protein
MRDVRSVAASTMIAQVRWRGQGRMSQSGCGKCSGWHEVSIRVNKKILPEWTPADVLVKIG